MGSFIRDVDFVPTDSDSTRRDLLVNITETSRTGLFSLGGGYGTEGGIFGVAEVGENNLFGRAYRVHLKGELGARDRHTGEVRFSTPWVLGTPTRFSASVYDTKRGRRYYGDFYRDRGYDRYTYTRRGASMTVGRPISKDMDLSVRLKNEGVDVTRSDPLFSIGLNHQADLEKNTISADLRHEFEVYDKEKPLSQNATISVQEEDRRWLISDSIEGVPKKYVAVKEVDDLDIYASGGQPYDRSTRSVTFFLSRDTRDYRTSLYEPVSGSFNTLSYEYSGGFLGARNKFQKYSLDSSWFASTWGRMVFAAHVRGGYLNSKRNESEFLFFERYLLGGIDTVRGYSDYEIFPSNGNPNGGNKVFYANFEYRIPLANQLTGVAFFDIGQVWDESVRNVFGDLNFKKGVGVGIRFDLMGMLAL